jgi:hypothetical protein
MTALNTFDDVKVFAGTIYADAMLIARENSVMPALVRTFNDQRGLMPRKNAKYGTVTVNTIGETDDLTSQAFTPSVDQTLTPYEYGDQVFLTDLRLEGDIYQVRNDSALELGRGIGVKVDTMLATAMANFTGGTCGGTTTAFTWAQFLSGVAKLRGQYAPQPYYCVLSPYQYYDLGTAIGPGAVSSNVAPSILDDFARQFFVQQVAGVTILIDGNLGTGATIYGGMFSREALGLDWRRAPRLEPERDASRRGWELNMSAVWGHGVWRPQYGVVIAAAGTISGA